MVAGTQQQPSSWEDVDSRPEIGQVLAFISLLALILAGVATMSQLLLQRMDCKQAVCQAQLSLEVEYLKASPPSDSNAHSYKEHLGLYAPGVPHSRSSSDSESSWDSFDHPSAQTL
ncbi:MAG: hypothetical protein WDW38_009649 [Sanguina aurantia]